jgi:hypothetical protein
MIMGKFLTSLVLALLGWVPLASAQTSVVVVELYTSQGCSSCPAADVILSEIAKRRNVIALGLHVDYWDYLGWRDGLARPEFTRRQETYNVALRSRYRLVTPQMIIQGRDYVAGAKRRKLLEYIDMLGKMPEGAALDIERRGTMVKISLAPVPGQTVGEAVLHVVRFDPLVKVAIEGGENQGRHMNYTNTVTRWDTIADWNGKETVELTYEISAGDNLAVIVQTKGHGPILAARRLD